MVMLKMRVQSEENFLAFAVDWQLLADIFVKHSIIFCASANVGLSCCVFQQATQNVIASPQHSNFIFLTFEPKTWLFF